MTCPNHRVNDWNANMFQLRSLLSFSRHPYQRWERTALSVGFDLAFAFSFYCFTSKDVVHNVPSFLASDGAASSARGAAGISGNVRHVLEHRRLADHCLLAVFNPKPQSTSKL